MSERARVIASLGLALLAPPLLAQAPSSAAVRAAEARLARVQARYDVASDSLRAEQRGLLSSSPSRELSIGGMVVRVPASVTAADGAAAAAELTPVLTVHAGVADRDRDMDETLAGISSGPATA